MDRRDRHAAVDAAVRDADPLGLLGDGAPSDEYDREIAEIERRLRPGMAPAETADVVDEVMRERFSAETWREHRDNTITRLSERLSQVSRGW